MTRRRRFDSRDVPLHFSWVTPAGRILAVACEAVVLALRSLRHRWVKWNDAVSSAAARAGPRAKRVTLPASLLLGATRDIIFLEMSKDTLL